MEDSGRFCLPPYLPAVSLGLSVSRSGYHLEPAFRALEVSVGLHALRCSAVSNRYKPATTAVLPLQLLPAATCLLPLPISTTDFTVVIPAVISLPFYCRSVLSAGLRVLRYR